MITTTLSQVKEGNKEIRTKLGQMPDADKVLTDKQYEENMSFILKH